MKFNRGFTLIELLVVIAIIGILSSVVLSSLNTARNKGANANVKSNLANARAQAELYYANNIVSGAESYISACAAGGLAADGVTKNIDAFYVAANAQSPATGAVNTGRLTTTAASTVQSVCHASATAWAIEVPLKVQETSGYSCTSGTPCLYWCTDSTGFSGPRINIVTNSGAAQYACPAS